ncbi:MAG: rhomboid family intramembrane serine protease [Phycisphaerae bacterium]
MSQTHPPSSLVDPVSDRLIEIQQSLLGHGFSYVAGNAEAWPEPFVAMGKEDQLIVAAPLDPTRHGRALEVWDGLKSSGVSRGLLLVGSVDVDDQRVRSLPAQLDGAVAYVEARTGRFTLHRKRPAAKLMTKGNLKRVLAGAKAKGFPPDRCQERLVEDMRQAEENQAFFQRATQVSQAAEPRLTWTLIGASVAVFAAMLVFVGLDVLRAPTEQALLDWGALFGPLVRQGQYWRLITAGFLHIGVLHLLFNSFALNAFGSLLERLQGRGRLLGIYVFSILAASIASLWYNPAVISAGASGGIFGLFGAIGALILRHRKDFPPHLRQAMRKMLLTILFYNVLFFFLLGPIMDNAAHVGGLVGGFAMAMVVTRSPIRRQKLPGWAVVAVVALVAALAGAGVWTISRIPTDIALPDTDGELTAEEIAQVVQKVRAVHQQVLQIRNADLEQDQRRELVVSLRRQVRQLEGQISRLLLNNPRNREFLLSALQVLTFAESQRYTSLEIWEAVREVTGDPLETAWAEFLENARHLGWQGEQE